MNEYIKNRTLLSALITSLGNNIPLSKQEEKDIRRYLEDYQKALNEIERLQKIIFSAMHYIDQVLGYHLSSGYEQLDKDCNELYGILKGVDKE